MQQKRGMIFPFRKHNDGNSTDPTNNWIWILNFHVSISFTESRNFVLCMFKGLLQRIRNPSLSSFRGKISGRFLQGQPLKAVILNLHVQNTQTDTDRQNMLTNRTTGK